MSDEPGEHLISFFDPAYDPVVVKARQPLYEVVDATNSPLLFGCRTGICGTCLIEVEGDIPPASPEEQELLDIHAQNNPRARLACQIEVTNPIRVKPISFS